MDRRLRNIDDFDSFTRFASRILPAITPPPSQGSMSGPSSAMPSRPASTDPTSTTSSSSGGAKVESAYTARALPIKFYLPDNAPVIHELVPPLTPDGAFSSSCPLSRVECKHRQEERMSRLMTTRQVNPKLSSRPCTLTCPSCSHRGQLRPTLSPSLSSLE